METNNQQGYLKNNQGVTFRELVTRINAFITYLWSKKLRILVSAILFTILLAGYNSFKTPSYTARTTFVLESDSESGLGQFSSLASLAGVNLNGFGGGGVLFQIDNIQELYRSRRMIEEALLAQINNSDYKFLIDFFASASNLESKWTSKLNPSDLDFSKSRESFSRAQDSLLMELTDIIQENHLMVSKPSRKLSILEVAFEHKDESLAKVFNETLVRKVNDFYKQTKTKKARETLSILQNQTDSVKRVLDMSIEALAQETEQKPNLNKLLATENIRKQKLNIDVQTSGLVYAEMIKNLEVAKTSLRNTTPLIQIIDYPILPLEDNIWTILKVLFVGMLLGTSIATSYFSIKFIYHKIFV